MNIPEPARGGPEREKKELPEKMAGDDNMRSIRFVAPGDAGPFLVNRFSGTERLGNLYEYHVDLLSLDQSVAFPDLMGQPVAMVIAAKNDDVERIVHGYVSRFSQTERLGRYMQYQATIVPYLWFLNRAADCRIMPTMLTVPEIVKQVLSERGFDDLDDQRLTGHYPKRPYCVQYRETDFNFISRLLEDEGIYYYFEHKRIDQKDEFKHVMVLCDTAAKHELGEGCEALHIADEDSAVTESITAWSVSGQAHADQTYLMDFSFETRAILRAGAVATAGAQTTDPLDAPFENPFVAEVADHPAGFHAKYDSAARDDLASMRSELHAAKRIVRRGVTNAHGLFAGMTFKLDGASQSGEEYLVVASTHSGWSDVGESSVVVPDSEPYVCAFEAINAKRQFRPARVTPKPVIVGPQTALVVGDASNHAFTDEFGRVRVKFPWDSDPGRAEKSSCLIRVSQQWAGNRWGAMFMPRVGHEVVVEFLEGDPDRPVITGRLYNGLSKPPYDPRKHASVSTIKSMTTDDGHGYNELRFEDKKGREQLYMHAQRRMDERVGAGLFETVAGNREEHIGTDDKGDRNRLVSNNVNVHAKGGDFILIEKKLNQNVKLDVVRVFEDAHTVAVSDRQTLNAKEIAIEAEQAVSLKSDKITLQGAGALSLKAGDVKIEGTTCISLKVGGNFLVLSPSGAFVMGSSVAINSGGAPQPADAPLTIEDPSLDSPIDAAVATSALPGDFTTGGRGGTPRVGSSRKVALRRAPEPPPPPPIGPRSGAGAADRKFIDIAWIEEETFCGGPATLKGTTKGYAAGASEDAEIRNVIDGATVVSVPVAIRGNAFHQSVEVKDWLPRKSGDAFEEFRDEDAFAAGQKTPKALKMKFIPSLGKAECSIVSRTGVQSRFAMQVKDYVCQVLGEIGYVRGFMGQLIKLGAHVPAETQGKVNHDEGEEDDKTLSGKDWRFARAHPSDRRKMQYWNGADWKDVPADWKDNPAGTKLFGIGIWRDGAVNRAQFSLIWPDPIPEWTAAQQGQADKVFATWKTQTHDTWTNKFDLRRDGCSSANEKCCRYSVQVTIDFKPVDAGKMTAHTIVVGIDNARSNSGAWSIADTDPGLAPHEFGHHLGCPDEYEGAGTRDKSVTTDIPDVSKAGIDYSCLMGSVPPDSIPPIKARHLDIIKQHLSAMIKDQKSVAFTFKAIPHT